jgi:hypothetical protein
MSSIAGTAPGATSFVPSRITDGVAYYTLTGQTKATAPFAILTDGTTQVGVKTVTGGALSVAVVDGTGTQITAFGAGTQYVGDAAATSTPTGTMDIGLAHAAAPSDVSADNDAVSLWALRNGSQVMNLAVGGTLITNLGQAAANKMFTQLTDGSNSVSVIAATNAIKADISSIGGTAVAATAPLFVELSTGAGAYTLFGQTAAASPFTRITDATTTVGVISGTTALKTDMSSIAGTATVTGGVSGLLAVAGAAASGASISGNPVLIGGTFTTTQPTVTTGQAVNLQTDNRGALMITTGVNTPAFNLSQYLGSAVSATNAVSVTLSTGAAAYTLFGQTAAASPFTRITDATTTVGVIAGTTALKTDLSSIAGTAPSATSAVPSRITDGTAYYTKTGQTAGTAAYAQLSDQTNTVSVIAGTNALKTDTSSIAGAVPSATNPLPVRLTDGAAFYTAVAGAPTAATYSTQTSSALGAGSSATVTHYVTSGKTGQLMGVDIASTVPLKVVINTVVTTTPTARIVLFTQPYSGLTWRAPYKTFITQASSDASSGFSVTFTNKDAAVAADVYSTAYWDQV